MTELQEKRAAKIREGLNLGKSLRQIAAEMRISFDSVRTACRLAGIKSYTPQAPMERSPRDLAGTETLPAGHPIALAILPKFPSQEAAQ
jgi:hypothetical protein